MFLFQHEDHFSKLRELLQRAEVQNGPIFCSICSLRIFQLLDSHFQLLPHQHLLGPRVLHVWHGRAELLQHGDDGQEGSEDDQPDVQHLSNQVRKNMKFLNEKLKISTLQLVDFMNFL